MRAIWILAILFVGLIITMSTCELEDSGACTNAAPLTHTIAVEDGTCRHMPGYNTPTQSGCWSISCHKGSATLSSGSARSCYHCHSKLWQD
ncbi:MAG: hypothetical protein OEZ36_07865 [Spirochaetota bacterium]|nr:hypothetical protein [Spirochaetota bacterium]